MSTTTLRRTVTLLGIVERDPVIRHIPSRDAEECTPETAACGGEEVAL